LLFSPPAFGSAIVISPLELIFDCSVLLLLLSRVTEASGKGVIRCDAA
jgi:hypothetical protein